MSTRAVTPRSRKDRDAGLARIKQLTNWSLAGALAGTGLFAGLAATHTAPATSATKATQTITANPATTVPATTGESDDGPSPSGTAVTVTPPTTPSPSVVASNSPFIVTSGAS